MSRFQLTALALSSFALATPGVADDVSDSLTAALAAYDAGDLRTTTAQLAAATVAVSQKKTALLEAILPPVPEGWTREVNSDYSAGIAMMGGGTGTEASYSDANGNRISVNYTMDSPMLAMMIGMFASGQTMAMMGSTVDVNGVKMVDQDNSLVTVVDGRILVQINGDQTEKLLPLAKTIDWDALAAFDVPK